MARAAQVKAEGDDYLRTLLTAVGATRSNAMSPLLLPLRMSLPLPGVPCQADVDRHL